MGFRNTISIFARGHFVLISRSNSRQVLVNRLAVYTVQCSVLSFLFTKKAHGGMWNPQHDITSHWPAPLTSTTDNLIEIVTFQEARQRKSNALHGTYMLLVVLNLILTGCRCSLKL